MSTGPHDNEADGLRPNDSNRDIEAEKERLAADIENLFVEMGVPRSLADIYESLNERQKEIASALFDTRNEPAFAFESDQLAPTPGDPEHVWVDGKSYPDEGWGYIEDRYTTKANPSIVSLATMDVRKQHPARPEITAEQLAEELFMYRMAEIGIHGVIDELHEGHTRQVKKNASSTSKLRSAFLLNPKSFTTDEIPRIESVRTGSAESIDRVLLLGHHPQMGSVEDMEASVPLDIEAYENVLREYDKRLVVLRFEHPEIRLDLTDFQAEGTTFEDLTNNGGYGISMSKKKIASAIVGTTEIELMLKQRFYRFPQKPQLRKIRNNFMQRGSQTIDFQPVAIQAYWRLKKETLQIAGSSKISTQAFR